MVLLPYLHFVLKAEYEHKKKTNLLIDATLNMMFSVTYYLESHKSMSSYCYCKFLITKESC